MFSCQEGFPRGCSCIFVYICLCIGKLHVYFSTPKPNKRQKHNNAFPMSNISTVPFLLHVFQTLFLLRRHLLQRYTYFYHRNCNAIALPAHYERHLNYYFKMLNLRSKLTRRPLKPLKRRKKLFHFETNPSKTPLRHWHGFRCENKGKEILTFFRKTAL